MTSPIQPPSQKRPHQRRSKRQGHERQQHPNRQVRATVVIATLAGILVTGANADLLPAASRRTS